jgi:hypothetical protein
MTPPDLRVQRAAKRFCAAWHREYRDHNGLCPACEGALWPDLDVLARMAPETHRKLRGRAGVLV